MKVLVDDNKGQEKKSKYRGISVSDQVSICVQFHEGKTPKQIAESLGLCTDTVYKYLHKNELKPMGRRPKMCRLWHERLKTGDSESIFTDPDFIASLVPTQATRCYDYQKLKTMQKG